MNLYQPLDLSSAYNAGQEIHSRLGRTASIGEQSFHGLPFRIGSGEDARCFIAFSHGEPNETFSIPVDATARYLIFAHALLNSRRDEGDPVGNVAAEYTVVFDDGERVVLPIRERFEIAEVPVEWGHVAFLAVPDTKNFQWPRQGGPWGDAGFQQTEAGQGDPVDYWLYDWTNPRPEVRILSIEVRGTGYLPMVLAAITVSHAEEEPFHRTAAVPVQVTLPQSEDNAGQFSLEVQVDRGVATYPYPLPAKAAEGFLTDDMKGFGEPAQTSNGPAYVHVAASPSATVSLKREDETIAEANWGQLQSEGAVETDRARFEIVDTGRNWVHTTVLDDETGRPIPCRIHFRDVRGIPYQPHGHHAHVHSDAGSWHVDVGGDVKLGHITYAYIDGKCQGWLPRGEVIVDVARGFEYEPLRTKVEISPGQRELTLRLTRKVNMNQQRYFSGDTHVHFLSTQGALTEAAGEDLDVVNLLLSQWGHLFTNTEEFTGRPQKSLDGETIVHATQENRQHVLGHLTLLNLKEPVMPWCTDGPGEAEMGGNLETTMSRWADACHAQGGTVVLPHFPNPNGESAVLVATGRVDAVEMFRHGAFEHLEYYRYLNGGYRLPLVGGTDKMDSAVPVGLYRTYAYIPPEQEFTYDNWCNAMRGGNTFLSSGPLLKFLVNGEPMGTTLNLGEDGGTVEIEAEATSIFPIHTLQIIHNGLIVASTEDGHGARELKLSATLKVEEAGWLCARCAGPGYASQKHYDVWGRGIMAHTSPVYLSVGGAYDVFSSDTAQYMLTLIDGSLQYLRKRAPQWEADKVTHHHDHHDHQEFLESPFHEAAEALHRKMHEHGIPH